MAYRATNSALLGRGKRETIITVRQNNFSRYTLMNVTGMYLPLQIQNRILAFIFSDHHYWGIPQQDCKAWGSVKDAELNHSRDFQGTVFALLYMNKHLHSGRLSTLPQIVSSAYTTRVLKHIKGDVERADSSAGQLQVTHTTSEFSVLTSGNVQEHGVPCFLFRSTVFQVGWSPGHACIFSHSCKLQVD